MLELRPAPRRWPGAVRSAVCLGVPLLIGWRAGDLGAGLMATLGGFTALYGSGRPYLNRAALLATIAVSLSVSVGVGIWAAAYTWLGILAVAAIATTATVLCNTLEVGPPGAYQFAMVCAVGIGLHAAHQNPVRSAVLVLAGGAFSWLVHMAGALIGPRRPERRAVSAGGAAVAAYIDAVDTPAEDATRHAAAQAMHEAWKTLITRQPRRLPPTATLRRLRDVSRQLHTIFAEAMGAARSDTSPETEAAATARGLAEAVWHHPSAVVVTPAQHLPLGRPGAGVLIRQYLQPHTRSRLVVLRVAVATVVAGTAAGALGLDHAYWAMTAAVLVLHQGLDRRRMTQRALERLVGTWVGLLLATAVIATDPHALWLVAVVMALTFLIELTVVRNCTLAVVFITAVALVISTGSHPTDDLGSLLLARGIDTAVGCAVAIAVFLVIVPSSVKAWLPTAVADALEAVGRTVAQLADGTITTPQGKSARRDLQRCVLQLSQMFDVSINGSPQQRRRAESLWPAIAATQRLAYHTIAECWRRERHDGHHTDTAATYLNELQSAVAMLAADVRAQRRPAPLIVAPGPFTDELRSVHAALD